MQSARRRAVEALGGYVHSPVGNATHYHADYVWPWWSPRLDKVAVVGTHIFYRWRGFWGTRPAFRRALVDAHRPAPLRQGGTQSQAGKSGSSNFRMPLCHDPLVLPCSLGRAGKSPAKLPSDDAVLISQIIYNSENLYTMCHRFKSGPIGRSAAAAPVRNTVVGRAARVGSRHGNCR